MNQDSIAVENNFEEKYEIPYEENFQFKEEEKLEGGMAISPRNPIKFLGFFMLSCISMIILFENMGFQEDMTYLFETNYFHQKNSM